MAVRAVVRTLNLWPLDRWPERRESLVAFLRMHDPDLLCVQEPRPETLSVILEALPYHEHVRDPFPGWTREGNLFWRRGSFEAVAGFFLGDIAPSDHKPVPATFVFPLAPSS